MQIKGVASDPPGVNFSTFPARKPNSAIFTNRFDRTNGHSLFASRVLGFILGLLADIGVGVFERAREIFGSSVATDVAIDTGRVDIKRAVNVFFYGGISIRHAD